MKKLLLAAVAALFLIPNIASAKTYNYNYKFDGRMVYEEYQQGGAATITASNCLGAGL